jgi:hypothetical protein
LEKSTYDVCICVLSVLMTGYRPDTRKSERSKLEHYCIFFCIVVVHHLCTHYNTQVHFLTASRYQSWQKSFLLFSDIQSDRNSGCRLNLHDSGLPEIFGWIIMYFVYTPLSGADGADDGESFMWWESWQSL